MQIFEDPYLPFSSELLRAWAKRSRRCIKGTMCVRRFWCRPYSFHASFPIKLPTPHHIILSCKILSQVTIKVRSHPSPLLRGRKMAEAIVSIVVERLGDLLIQKAISLHGVSDQVQQLQDELKRIQSLLKDADARQNERESVRKWVADIRDVAYDAEDIIERYALKVGSRKGGGIQNVLKRFACILGEAKTIFQTSSEIGEMTKRISSLKSSLENYGIKFDSMEGGGPSSLSEKIREQRQTFAHVEHDHVVVGLEENLKEVVACLTEEVKDKYRVSICGMGGLGKTTLARKAYHHPQVKSHFECFAWACISQQCKKRDVWEGVMIDLSSPSDKKRKKIREMRDAELAKELCEILRRKKCLVVLDDIWKVEDWKILKAAFPMNDTNSRILLTSRNEDLALQVDPRGHLHKLKFLNDEDSWELLQNLAISWRSEDSEIKKEKSSLGKEMVRHCKGLPLAVIVLGGLLATKQTLEEWKQVHRNVKSYLHQQKDLGISTVLALSYDDLPSHLKLCFLYLGHFPEDFEIRTKELIQMWMAEGLILQMQHTESNKETLEDVGERYLQELVQRCMVQVGKKSSVAGIKTCRLHDLMRDFCVVKANSENFLHVININDESNEEIKAPIGEVRRVAISGGSNLVTVLRSQKYFHLRSLLTFSVPLKDQKSMLRNLKFLRVLNFLRLTFDPDRVMDFPAPEIKSLIHLRFLSLRYTVVRSIPSLGNLKCLQTLDLRSTDYFEVVNVPNDVVRNMEHLRHLYLPLFREVSGKLQLPNASKLQTLVNIPVFICDVKDPTAGFDEFGKNLMPSNFTFNCLHVLKITIQDRRDNKRVDITPMVMSCPHIYRLRLWGEIEKLPEHDKISPYLVQLKLYKTGLEEDPMLTLEKFPCLKFLHLLYHAYIGMKMICSVRGFPQLQSLILADLYNLEEWEVEEGSLPSLCHLRIKSCANLRMVPDGLQFVTTLQKLEIMWMPRSFVDRLGEGGQDFYKIRHVSSLEISYTVDA